MARHCCLYYPSLHSDGEKHSFMTNLLIGCLEMHEVAGTAGWNSEVLVVVGRATSAGPKAG